MNVSFYSIAFEIQYSARLRFIFKFSNNRCNTSTHPFWSSLLLQSSSLCRPIGSIWNTWQFQDITVLWKCTTFAILHRRLYLKIKKEGLFTCDLSAHTTPQYLTCFETRVYSVHLAKILLCWPCVSVCTLRASQPNCYTAELWLKTIPPLHY